MFQRDNGKSDNELKGTIPTFKRSLFINARPVDFQNNRVIWLFDAAMN